jgi:excinuclease ABC subunit C
MHEAAEAQRYELAARYRDQLAQLQATCSEQLVAHSGSDFDVVALARDGGSICVSVLFFRGGRLLGSRNHLPQHAAGASDDDVMRAFLLQYYGGRQAPDEILLDRGVEEAELLADLFSTRSERRVALKWRLRGDRARWVEMSATNAVEAARQRNRSQESLARQIDALQAALGMDGPPERIECFDISHTGGEATVASCVVFTRDGPLKSAYRRFNIRDVEPGDDYGAMREVVGRRFRHAADPEFLPDLILIDGGKGQLAQAQRVLDESGFTGVMLAGVAKGAGRKPGRERIYLTDRATPITLADDSAASHIIQQIRDEAHRFAIAGHRGRRQKQVRRSVLEDISGLGPKRRQALLRHFGGLQAVTRAGVDELARVRGISRHLAENIYQRFHSD